jgi:hypothetical protein
MNMRVTKVLSAIGLLAMTAALIYGFTAGNFRTDGSRLLQNPWGVVSIVDLYTGFILFSLWIIYREKSTVRSVLWVGLMMVLGFFTASLYTLLAAYSSGNSWKTFWMGRRADG